MKKKMRMRERKRKMRRGMKMKRASTILFMTGENDKGKVKG
jgi:hypothetical protein